MAAADHVCRRGSSAEDEAEKDGSSGMTKAVPAVLGALSGRSLAAEVAKDILDSFWDGRGGREERRRGDAIDGRLTRIMCSDGSRGAWSKDGRERRL